MIPKYATQNSYLAAIEDGILRPQFILYRYDVCYKSIIRKEKHNKEKKNEARMVFADKLISMNKSEAFIHKDYFALALNYLVHRMKKSQKLNSHSQTP